MKNLPYSKLKSHPNKYLENHLENVANFSKNSFDSLNFQNNKLFAEISYLIGICHDFGKSTSFFQKYLLNNEKNENTPHSFISAIFTYYVVNNYLKNKNICFENNLAIISYIVVLHHHGNIKNIGSLDEYHEDKFKSKIIQKQIDDLTNTKINLEEYYKNKKIDLKNFFENIDEISENISDDLLFFEYDSQMNNYFVILLFYSVLLDADKMDASETDLIKRKFIPEDIVETYKHNHNFNSEGINKIREKAFIEVCNNIKHIDLQNRIFSINLPTGIGKTLTGFAAALKLKNRICNELSFNPRIIYSLPFLSVIDQNEMIIRNIFEENNLKGNNILLKHNHLSELKYSDEDRNEIYEISNSKILIEGWNSEFIITTFIQLFYSVIGNKNSSLRKFHNITNSIIILDEIQSIPYKYWKIVNSILKKLAYEYNCWIILMTATQPFIFKENEIKPLVSNEEFYFKKMNRVNYNFSLANISLDEFYEKLLKVIDKELDKDILIVLNTVNSSKNLYELIKQHYLNNNFKVKIDEDGICNIGDNINLIYLSTNIIPFHRLKKINAINKESDKQNIIISTQLIEAGIDIDVDIVYRDFAPLDSIIQTAGRCNRSYTKEKGLVNVVSLVNDKDHNFSNYVYQGLLLSTTKEVLKDISNISEKEFNLYASNKYFELISKRSFEDEELVNILNYLKFNEINSKFKLIENLPNKIDIFVCINTEAESILNEYKYITDNLYGFDKNIAFLKIKNKFYQYIISVDEDKFGSTNIYNEIGVIYAEDLERKYALDIGFIYAENEEPMIW